MKNTIHKTVFVAAALAVLSLTGFASRQPDLEVRPWAAPAAPMVNTAYQYTATVRNGGNLSAQNVVLTIEFPLTETSPNRYILGKVTAIPPGCTISQNKLVCSLGTIRNSSNPSRSVTFNFEYPVTTKPLNLVARVTTSTGETNQANNSLAFAPTVRYPDLAITSANVLNSLCTGQGLTSFFECELFPSSISSFPMTLEQGGTITVDEPGYYGTWSQPALNRLQFSISNGVDGAQFDGYASGASCFEGITTFTPPSPYSSPYKVCIQ